MASKQVFVTGHKEIDRVLSGLPLAMQKKFVRHALRVSTKKVQKDFERNVKDAELIDTKAFLQSTKVKATKRSRNKVGMALFTDTEAMHARRKKKLTGSKESLKDIKANNKFGDEFFYPAVLEFGDAHHPPHKPMRKALYDNAKAVQAYFEGDVLSSIQEAARKAT